MLDRKKVLKEVLAIESKRITIDLDEEIDINENEKGYLYFGENGIYLVSKDLKVISISDYDDEKDMFNFERENLKRSDLL